MSPGLNFYTYFEVVLAQLKIRGCLGGGGGGVTKTGIYKLGDVGILSNLIGSLSLANGQNVHLPGCE